MARKARKLTAIMVRLPDPLHRELVRLASAGARSLNSEIIGRLEKSVALDSGLPPEVELLIDRFVKMHADLEKKLEKRLFKGLDRLVTENPTLARRALKLIREGEDKS
jgi:hypothetical protein